MRLYFCIKIYSDMKRYAIPFRPASSRSDFACNDGEVSIADNLIADFSESSENSESSGCSENSGSSEDSGGVRMTMPPAPEAEFRLKYDVLDGWHIHPDMLPSRLMPKGEGSEAGWGKIASAVLDRFRKDARRQNLFTEPFFVICALRLKGGERIMPSPTMLMIPNSESAPVAGSTDFSADEMRMSVAAAVCRLQWRVRIPDTLRDFEEVTHVDILVSDEMPLSDRKSEWKSYHRLSFGGFTHSLSPDGGCGERRITEDALVQCWRQEPMDEADMLAAMLTAKDYRVIMEIPVENARSVEEWEDVVFNCGGLSSLSAKTPYRPDYAHLSEVEAAGMTDISGRATLYDFSMISPLPFALSQTAPYADTSGYAPRWVFHPDPEARQYLFERDGVVRTLPLWRHPHLYGSYYWCGLDRDSDSDVRVVDDEELISGSLSIAARRRSYPGGIWRSSVGSCLHFPDSLSMQLHVGRIITLVRAFRSSGLVATTAPTVYAFTTDGVFLLKEMEDATFRDAGLVCGYVPKDAGAVESLGRGVRFTTASGEVVTIEGTSVRLGNATDRLTGGSAIGTIAYKAIDTAKECRLVTRPLEFGDSSRSKWLWGVEADGDYDRSRMMMTVWGSVNLRDWYWIGSGRGGAIGLYGAGSRYWRVEMRLMLNPGDNIQGLRCSLR